MLVTIEIYKCIYFYARHWLRCCQILLLLDAATCGQAGVLHCQNNSVYDDDVVGDGQLFSSYL